MYPNRDFEHPWVLKRLVLAWGNATCNQTPTLPIWQAPFPNVPACCSSCS